MRQIMQAMVALAVLMSSSASVFAAVTSSNEANDSVSAKAQKAVAEIVAARKITGTVYDAATKEPLPGVRVQGTGHSNVTTMTNPEGKYTLNVPSYVTLLNFSTPGYALVQRPVQDNEVIDVYIYTDKFSTEYNEDIEITATNAAKISYGPALTVDNEIVNNLGADVRSITRSGTPGVGAAMFIRGINSLNANTQPLVVVDGVIMDLQENTGTIHLGAYNNILSAIDINDIDDVRVLKNATALYGARAANGVILITTKRGKSMATRITANIYGGVTLTPNLPDM
ncbi:MAG: TonB-dependent receptor plug domain-containing protein, partial [Bacteroidaceae bacterium]|nr:TonB-dependent receptor plug domain-containing protein [Bacteroidaceae bacterium]